MPSDQFGERSLIPIDDKSGQKVGVRGEKFGWRADLQE
jgi:hypothetical protein